MAQSVGRTVGRAAYRGQSSSTLPRIRGTTMGACRLQNSCSLYTLSLVPHSGSAQTRPTAATGRCRSVLVNLSA